ncbi:MAG TPA: acyl-ACP thioesterase domain-containing protein [Acidimicrobiales bacterium]|nr:acyl-ACP thioesterase domain-containing protein [Acidimicrobiales bacterium]
MPGLPPAGARRVTTARRVRLADVRPDGRARLDAVARWCQDVAADDLRTSGAADAWRWVVRRTLVEVTGRRPVYDEQLEVTTWCSGSGAAWAERRTSIHGDAGGAVEVAALWVALDPATMRPSGLDERFDERYGSATGGRRVRAGLLHRPTAPDGTPTTPWPLRIGDLDVLGHVTNAIAWALLEDVAATGGVEVVSASAEYRDQLRDGPLQVATEVGDGGLAVWAAEPGRPPGLTIEAAGRR